MFDGNDIVHLGAGNDEIHLSSGRDAIEFAGGDNEPSILTFDYNGQSIANAFVNSQEYIRSDLPETKGNSQIKVRSHNVLLSSHGGDIILEFGSEY